MRKPIEPTKKYGDADFLRREIKRCKDAKLIIRLQAVLYRLQGKSIQEIVGLLDIHRSSIHQWVNQWNKGGLDKLLSKPRPGRKPKIDVDTKELIIQRINGSLKDGKPYTVVAIEGFLKKKRPDLIVSYRTLCRNLHQWGFRRLRPRPMALKADPRAQAAFIEKVNILQGAKLEPDIWFYDESGVWGDPNPYLVWAPIGSKPTVPYYGGKLKTTIAGAVRPSDGYFFSLILSNGDSDLFQIFLDELNDRINKKKRNIMILDNASFHHAKRLEWGAIESLFLPPYSPVLNPIEELWLQLKKKFFNQYYAKSQEELEERTMLALNHYMDRPEIVKSACAMSAYL